MYSFMNKFIVWIVWNSNLCARADTDHDNGVEVASYNARSQMLDIRTFQDNKGPPNDEIRLLGRI